MYRKTLQLLNLMCYIFALLLNHAECLCCKSNGRTCPDPYSYQLCTSVVVNNVTTTKTIGQPVRCPDGSICDDQGNFACKWGTVPPTTTTPLPTTLPACFDGSKFPAKLCNEYYECIQVLWWWEPQLKSCPDGQGFDPASSECAPAATVPCGHELTTTTTTVAPEAPPSCDGAGRYPGPADNQYYECAYAWFRWRPYLQTCPDEQVYDKSAQECVGGTVLTGVPLGEEVSATTILLT